MQQWLRSALIFVAGVLAACAFLTVYPMPGAAGSAEKWTPAEVPLGTIPSAWGEVVGVAALNQQSVVLFFRDDKPGKGNLRRVQVNQTGLSKVVGVIGRGY